MNVKQTRNRWASVCLAILLAVAVAWFHQQNTHHSLTGMIQQMEGEHWYRVSLNQEPVGQYRTVVLVDRTIRFLTEMRFRLDSTFETHIEETRVFAAEPPYQLIRARHTQRSGPHNTDVLEARVLRDRGKLYAVAPTGTRLPLTSDYGLADYLNIEMWLKNVLPRPEQSRKSKHIDFDRLDISTKVWSVVDHNAQGYMVRSANEHGFTEIQLDLDFMAKAMTDRHFFLDRVTDEAVAAKWRHRANSPRRLDFSIATAEPLRNPTKLSRLVLKPFGEMPWDDGTLLVGDSISLIKVDPSERASFLRETLRHPISDESITTLANAAAQDITSPLKRAQALTHFVHDYLVYEDLQHVQSVLDTVSRRRGDCSEFAELFTTLARAAMLPAKTVVGLAYDAGNGVFAKHAWNEIAIDGRWMSVDPTWNQIRADATHLRLSDETMAALDQSSSLNFKTLETTYVDGGS
jgi:hypothetical protein